MPKTASKKPITADKLGLAESMVGGAKKRRGRPKKFQTLAEVEADINLRELQKAQKQLAKAKLENKELKKKAKNFIKPEEITPSKDPVDDDKSKIMDFLTNVLQPSLTNIEENLSKILGNFDKQIETDKEKQDDLRVSEDTASDKAREAKLEKPKGKGMLGSSIDKAIKPVTGMMDMIMNFFKNILLGSAVMGLLKILENPEMIMKPLRDFANGIIDFANGLIKGINKFVLGPINFVVQGLLDGLQFILNPIGMLARIFKLGDFDLPLDKFRENIQPAQIPEIPRVESKVEMQGGGEVPQVKSEPIKMNKGGEVPGQGNTDTVPAMLTPGEFVMSKGAVEQYGVKTLEGMNAAAGGTNIPKMGKYSGGGFANITNTMTTSSSDSEGNLSIGKRYIAPGEAKEFLAERGMPSMELMDGTVVPDFGKMGSEKVSQGLQMTREIMIQNGASPDRIAKLDQLMAMPDAQPQSIATKINQIVPGSMENTMMNLGDSITASARMNGGGLVQGFKGGGLVQAFQGGGQVRKANMSTNQSGSKITPPPTPNSGSGGVVAMGGGNSGNSGGLTSGNAPAAKSGTKRFSSSDVRDDSNIIVQSIYNLVG